MTHTAEVPASAATGFPDDWHLANDAGVAHAALGRWTEATAAFEHALTLAARFADAPDVHAVLLSNLAQAHFRTGEAERAVHAARRAMAARLITCDVDDDAPMARIRADLAVYLAACGEHDEADAALTQARRAIESRFGDEDERLLSILENQARLALAAGRPAAAEPALLRLHALLAERGEDPARIDHLLARVASARATVAGDSAAVDGAIGDSATGDSATGDSATGDSATGDSATGDSDGYAAEPQSGSGVLATDADEPHAPEVEAMDAAFADASGEPAVEARSETPIEVFPVALADAAFDLVDDIDDVVRPAMRSPSAESIRAAGLVEPGQHRTPVEPKRTNPLGFEVQYGVPQELLLGGAPDPEDSSAPRPQLPGGGRLDNPFW